MKFKKKLLVVVISVVIFGTLIATIILIMNKPSVGTINTPKVTNTSTPTMDMTPVIFTSSYVSFSYPTGLTKNLKNSTVLPVIDDYNFSYSDIQPWNLAITIYSISGGALTDNNAYQVREIHPEQYQKSTQEVKGTSVAIMTDKTITYYNKVAFLIHGSYQATVSLSGDDPAGTGNLINTLNMILNSWTWRVD